MAMKTSISYIAVVFVPLLRHRKRCHNSCYLSPYHLLDMWLNYVALRVGRQNANVMCKRGGYI